MINPTYTQNVAKLLDEWRENTDIQIEVREKLDKAGTFENAMAEYWKSRTFYVVSHGASIKRPVIVYSNTAAMFRAEGYRVLNWWEYQEVIGDGV